jgi:predicted HicB family RNase H-like nuclease
MAIVRNPKRLRATASDRKSSELRAEASISGANGAEATDQNKKPTMIRIDPDLLTRIDRAAKRLGISRSAFIVSSAARELERMEA